MKRKIILVAALYWAVSGVAGGLWGRIEVGRGELLDGTAEVQRLRDLYLSQQYDKVLQECILAEDAGRFREDEPEILYIRWATDRQCGRYEDADKTRQTFLQRFPASDLGADIHFTEAMSALSRADYALAEQTLDLIVRHYPSAVVTPRAIEILTRLRSVVKAVTTRQSP